MARLNLTDADMRVLSVLFADAHRQGRMTDQEHDETVLILAAARIHREREAALLADRSMG